jgi:hypothetical protein
MVPFVEVEPIPLNWSQEAVVDSSRGSHDAGKAVELILESLVRVILRSLRQCSLMFLRIRQTGRLTKLWGDLMWLKKVRESSLISSLRLIMRGVEVVCLGTELREGVVVFSYEVQYSYVECERAELFTKGLW